MNQQPKIWVRTATAAAELLMELRLYTEQDGIITPEEQRLNEQARMVYALAEETAARKLIAQRYEGGGRVDANFDTRLRELDGLRRASKDRLSFEAKTVSKSNGD